MSPSARASQFLGSSRWQRGSVAGYTSESGPFLLQAGDRDVQMRWPAYDVSVLGCTSRKGGTGDRTGSFVNLFLIDDKTEYSKTKELQVPVP